LALTASDFAMTAQFGIFTGLTIIYALLADLILLPAMLALWPAVMDPVP